MFVLSSCRRACTRAVITKGYITGDEHSRLPGNEIKVPRWSSELFLVLTARLVFAGHFKLSKCGEPAPFTAPSWVIDCDTIWINDFKGSFALWTSAQLYVCLLSNTTRFRIRFESLKGGWEKKQYPHLALRLKPLISFLTCQTVLMRLCTALVLLSVCL